VPKLKTHRGANKRFTVLGSGKIKRGQSKRRHILVNKTTKQKRHLRGAAYISSANEKAVRAMLPFG